jgi:hypothetical protein
MKSGFSLIARKLVVFGLRLLVVSGFCGITAVRAEDTVQSVLDCMRGNLPPAVRVQDVELTSFDRSGKTRDMKGKLFVMKDKDKGLVRATLRISAPPDLSGAAYLLRESAGDGEDQMFVYLPAVSRVRRITGASADGSLMGTDLSYNDVKEVENAFSGSEVKLEPAEDLDGRAVWALSMSPRAGQASRYNLVRGWIDRKSCVALKVDFYENGEVRKELRAPASALQQSGTYWYASEAEMSDVKEGTKTRLRVVGVAASNSIPTGYFDPHSFYLGN